MADEQQPEDVQEADEKAKRPNTMLTAILWGTIGLCCGAGGFAVPILFPGIFGGEQAAAADEELPVEETNVKTAYIEFGEVVVNLNSDRLNRYLKITMTLLVKEDDLEELQPLIDEKKALLKSWALAYLSDVNMDDIRGAAGQNRLRREIQDHFNSVLFSDGYDRIREVLFEEFNIQ